MILILTCGSCSLQYLVRRLCTLKRWVDQLVVSFAARLPSTFHSILTHAIQPSLAMLHLAVEHNRTSPMRGRYKMRGITEIYDRRQDIGTKVSSSNVASNSTEHHDRSSSAAAS